MFICFVFVLFSCTCVFLRIRIIRFQDPIDAPNEPANLLDQMSLVDQLRLYICMAWSVMFVEELRRQSLAQQKKNLFGLVTNQTKQKDVSFKSSKIKKYE